MRPMLNGVVSLQMHSGVSPVRARASSANRSAAGVFGGFGSLLFAATLAAFGVIAG